MESNAHVFRIFKSYAPSFTALEIFPFLRIGMRPVFESLMKSYTGSRYEGFNRFDFDGTSFSAIFAFFPKPPHVSRRTHSLSAGIFSSIVNFSFDDISSTTSDPLGKS